MSPSNIARSKSIKERVSNYLSKRINGEPVIDIEQNQRKSTEQRFSDLIQVLHAAVEQPPPVKLGFRQRLMAELYAVFDSRDTIIRSSTTRDRRRHRQDSFLERSASTPHRRHNPEHSSSLRKSSSIPRGRRYHRGNSPILQRSSSTGHRQNHREPSPPPQSPPIAHDYFPPPLPRARSYRSKSFATKPDISAPLKLLNLNGHPALRNNANTPETPLTNQTDRLDRADFDVPPTLRNQPEISEQPWASQMPFHKRTTSQKRVDGNSHPKAPPGTTPRSIISTATRWGDFISESQSGPASQPTFNQATKVAPRQSQSPGRAQGGSQSPAKFPSFSPAAHQTRARSPLSRKPVADPGPSFLRTSSNQRPRGPVTCELCGGLSDPNTSYPDVKRHLCSKCARIAFGEPSKERSAPTTIPLPPSTPPVKGFTGFDFTGSIANPATPSSTGSQPKFEAYSTAAAAVEAKPPNTSSSVHRPRPPSSEYSCYPAPSRYASNMGNPYESSMGNNHFTAPVRPNTSSPSSSTVQRANATHAAEGSSTTPAPQRNRAAPTLPRIRTNLPVSTVSSHATLSPGPSHHHHTKPFIPFLPHRPPLSPTIPEQDSDGDDDDGGEARSPRSVDRRSSFYHFYDDVLGSERGGGTDAGAGNDRYRDKGKGKGKWWD